jgi:hypothetical protein
MARCFGVKSVLGMRLTLLIPHGRFGIYFSQVDSEFIVLHLASRFCQDAVVGWMVAEIAYTYTEEYIDIRIDLAIRMVCGSSV